MANKVYKISLTPLNTFYFGSERHFSSGEDGVNYLVRSNYFPQQTSLLGLLRYLVLEKKGLLYPLAPGKKPEDMENCVGRESFDSNNLQQKFGHIDRLSPLFLTRSGTILWPCPLGYAKPENGQSSYPIAMKSLQGRCSLDEGAVLNEIPVLAGDTGYYKKGFSEGWIDIQRNEFYETQEIFLQDERDGITKQDKGRNTDDKDAYFKQMFFRLKKEFCFTFYAKVEEGCLPESGIVMLGGEKSSFRMMVEPAPDINPIDKWPEFSRDAPRPPQWPSRYGGNCFWAVSPAFLNNDEAKAVVFSIGSLIDFRNLRATVSGTRNYTDVTPHGNGSNVTRSPRKINLMAAGSVLYMEQAITLEQLQTAPWHNIGYNYFIQIKH